MAVYDDWPDKPPKHPPYKDEPATTDGPVANPEARKEEAAKLHADRGSSTATKAEQQEKDAVASKTGETISSTSETGSDEPSLFNPSKDKPKKSGSLLNRLGKRAKGKDGKSNKAALYIGGGIGGVSLVTVILILIVLVGSLAIPGLASNISSWQFARTSRLFQQSVVQATEEKLTVDAASDTLTSSLRSRFEKLRFWSGLDKYRPQKVMETMESTGRLSYEYSEPQGVLGREKITAVIIDGEKVDVNSKSWLHPVESYQDKIRFTAQVRANVDESLRGSNTLVRGGVAKGIRDKLGVKLKWWEKKGTGYSGLKQAEADRLEARNSYKNTNGDLDPVDTGVQQVDNATAAADEALEACIADDGCLDEAIKEARDDTSSVPKSVQEAAEGALDNSALTALEFASTTYGIAVPLCIVYDGSLEKSGPTIDQRNEQLQRVFNGIQSAASQQKSGETTAQAVGATVRRLGDFSASVPEMRKYGKPVSSTTTPPQGSSYGDFTIFSALFGQGDVTNVLNGIASVCPVLTDWRTGAAIGAFELAIGFFTGGTETAGAKFFQVGLKEGLTEYAKALGREILTKKTFTRFLGEAAATSGATLIAKSLVMSRMGAEQNGLQENISLANNADMGGDLNANEINRQMLLAAPLTAENVAINDNADRQYLAQKQSEKSPYQRYLALDNPQSALSNVAMGISTKIRLTNTLGDLIADIPSYLANVGSVIFKVGGYHDLVSAQEATASDYGIVQWGYTPEESALIDNDPEYRPLRNAEVLENSGKSTEIEAAVGECFSATLGDLLSTQKIVRDAQGNVIADQGQCSPNNLGLRNPTFGDLVFRWRLAKRNEAVVQHLTDIQNPTKSDTKSGTTTEGGIGMSADGFVFPVKTTQAKVKAGSANDGQTLVWCSESQTNCHHDYNAADIFGETGTPVVAATDGEIVFANGSASGGTGSFVIMKSDKGFIFYYGHLGAGSVKVTSGRVKAGDVLGAIGTAADAQGTAPHLHFDSQASPPATTRQGCTNSACAQPPFNFLNVQPALVAAFKGLPAN